MTDNMFGIISDPGADPAKCGVNTPTGVLPTSVGLNCGDLRFDPASQGITVPTAPAADVLASHVFSPTTYLGDSNTADADFGTSSNAHASLDLENHFIWNNTAGSVTDGTLTVNCSAATLVCVGSSQKKHEVVATSGTSFGTLSTPGAGEQVYTDTINWSLTGNSGSIFSPPTINWNLQIYNPVYGDLIEGTFFPDNANRQFDTSAMSGSFTYVQDVTNSATFPTVDVPFVRNSTNSCGPQAGTCITIP